MQYINLLFMDYGVKELAMGEKLKIFLLYTFVIFSDVF